MIDPARWYTVADIVELLGIHEQTARRWLRTGELRGSLLGRKAGYRVQGAALQAFLDMRTPAAEQGKIAA